MKKTLSALLAFLLMISISGCGMTSNKVEPTEEPTETAVPTSTPTPAPEMKEGTIKDISVLATYKVLNRNDAVDITGENEEYYEIILDGENCFVLKNLIRLSTEEAAEKRTVYCQSNARLFDNVYLTGEPIATLDLNTELELIDELNGTAIVEYKGNECYTSSDNLRNDKTGEYHEDHSDEILGSGNYSGGSSSDSGSAGADGGDIALSYRIPTMPDTTTVVLLYMAAFPEFETAGLKGAVFADGTCAYIQEFGYGDKIDIAEQDGDVTIILYNDMLLSIPSESVRLSGEKKYENWDGYAKSGTKLCLDKALTVSDISLNRNDMVKVMEEYDGYYIVEYENSYYCVDKEMISEEKNSETAYYDDWDGGNYGGGSYSGGGGSGGDSEWTEPVM